MATAGCSGTPLWKKLGYKEGLSVFAPGGPAGYAALLALPGDMKVTWLKRPIAGMAFVHLFSTSASALKTSLKSLRKTIATAGVIWVSWPKKSSGVPTDITEDIIRLVALPMGLVDIKVCAVDDVRSGPKLVTRKELR